MIGGTVLDVFIYPSDRFRAGNDFDPEEFVQIWDGKILLDRDGFAARLQARVREYIDRRPPKTSEEIRQELDWCEKMVARTARGDAEGYYRWHWVLVDSLEIYDDIRGRYHYGPKKALRAMEQSDPEAFRIYERALREPDRERLAEWIGYLKSVI